MEKNENENRFFLFNNVPIYGHYDKSSSLLRYTVLATPTKKQVDCCERELTPEEAVAALKKIDDTLLLKLYHHRTRATKIRPERRTTTQAFRDEITARKLSI